MANQRIDVQVNPNNEPSATGVNLQERQTTASRPSNIKSIASIGIVANSGRQVFMSTLGQVGTITGNAQLQRNINKATTLFGIGAAFAVNPLVGTLSLATTAIQDTIQTRLKIRDENNSAMYYNKVNGRRIDKGRIK